MPILGVNIDHVATIRQARYREAPDSPHAEPDPVEAAILAELAFHTHVTREDVHCEGITNISTTDIRVRSGERGEASTSP